MFCREKHRCGGTDCLNGERLRLLADEIVKRLAASVRDESVNGGNAAFNAVHDGISQR